MTNVDLKNESPNDAKHVLPAVHLFPYRWNLKDANFTKDKGTVFSCFACGGGSSFGYKLAGFDVLGCNEIDPKMIERTTPENINSLAENQIFVFGSNLSGRHGKGAAKTALGWGAKYGQASGIQGKTYGIPTKDASIRRTLSIEEIKPFVDEFIEFAKANPNLIFLVTEIGTGLANHKKENIAPLFKQAVNYKNHKRK